MFVVKKPPGRRTAFVNATRVVRICPLSPRIAGPALPGVTPDTALDRYDVFYINEYHDMSDYLYINNL